MATAMRPQALRQTIEAQLAHSFSGALSPRLFTGCARLPLGIAGLDALTGGCVPEGAVTELARASSTGKTTAAMLLAAGAIRSGQVCAWEDASDSSDATGAARP